MSITLSSKKTNEELKAILKNRPMELYNNAIRDGKHILELHKTILKMHIKIEKLEKQLKKQKEKK